MKISLPSKRTLLSCFQGAVVGSIALSLGFYIVMMHPIPKALRPLSTHFYRQYQESNLVRPELNLQSTPEEHLIYMKRMKDWIGLETNVLIAALAEEQIYWSLVSSLIACGLWFPTIWLERKFEFKT
ncbi:MAG: hypothetical protein HC851_23320 [Acaryochloris sp. RU_4_1]|nr:hypothetical protein [Acaryochloris sp. RU_4_1]NJR57192.1 hypothetical protein [Acaryochloris sp. CRU_2_0]